MELIERMGNCAVVPVVVLDDAKDAVPTAKALLAGGIDVMEITLRTAAGLDAIRAVAKELPEMLVGAGTVLNLEQAKTVVEAGGRFIVSPGFDPELVQWCLENGVTVTPGCVTPTEIMAALKLGVNVIKFFPANVYGGLSAMKALAAPFGGVKFIPTGGVDGKNIAEYAAAPFIHTVGGSWVCTKADIAAGNFEKITKLSREATEAAMGFEIAHVGINTENPEAALSVANEFSGAFGFPVKDGNSSAFAGSGIEVMKSKYLGANGHLAVRTNNIGRALAYLEKKGLHADPETAKYKGDKMIAVYLKGEVGGFAVHLLQK
jgi:2-dehydro-3-deoxyphosphogluconate aldolase/(4S)-4-hydroxy-2-oxoglutarate aldolase